ncbi:hypothetical protein UZ36_06930 [Candidatus Nitromaritima sp. SCGC AAA799-C22]|nr:hypothetical protein UZ36_06930 [Candidatus Nitromaritima sp. SCGC AAA799-C22]
MGLIALTAILSIPYLLAPSLSPEAAKKWIRLYLRNQFMTGQKENLRIAEQNLPDRQKARTWETELRRLERIEFKSVEIKQFLMAPPSTSTRIYVARVVIGDSKGQDNARYFSLSARNNIFDFFWVNEHSKIMWWFSF